MNEYLYRLYIDNEIATTFLCVEWYCMATAKAWLFDHDWDNSVNWELFVKVDGIWQTTRGREYV
jgi:hypothetical protein